MLACSRPPVWVNRLGEAGDAGGDAVLAARRPVGVEQPPRRLAVLREQGLELGGVELDLAGHRVGRVAGAERAARDADHGAEVAAGGQARDRVDEVALCSDVRIVARVVLAKRLPLSWSAVVFASGTLLLRRLGLDQVDDRVVLVDEPLEPARRVVLVDPGRVGGRARGLADARFSVSVAPG